MGPLWRAAAEHEPGEGWEGSWHGHGEVSAAGHAPQPLYWRFARVSDMHDHDGRSGVLPHALSAAPRTTA